MVSESHTCQWLHQHQPRRKMVGVFETEHAVRLADIATSLRGFGKGSHRKWLPRAILRAAFGHTSASSIKSKMYRKAPGVFSLNSLAYWMKGSHGQISRASRCFAFATIFVFTAFLVSETGTSANDSDNTLYLYKLRYQQVRVKMLQNYTMFM